MPVTYQVLLPDLNIRGSPSVSGGILCVQGHIGVLTSKSGELQSKAKSFEFKVIGGLIVESGAPHQSQAGFRVIMEF